ncbi:MAG: TIGR00296 family protein [Thermoplasmata archaeon]|nr:MAG: TIGR00296 family protein [Thermoplasmata archaeon]
MQLEEGKTLVKYARNVIEGHVKGEPLPELDNFDGEAGAFVTLHTYPERMLRGCIGIPEPHYPLRRAIKEAAVSACHDPRFPHLREDELDRIIVEVSVLTPPRPLTCTPEEYSQHIVIGRDGLIVERGIYRGLLLPQVPVEYQWDEMEFLRQTCMKAGLPPDAWHDDMTKVYTFQGTVFSEERPRGDVVRVELHA